MRLLFLALSTRGFGETILGLRLAEKLRDRGAEVTFVAHATASELLKNSQMSHRTIPDHALPLLRLFLSQAVERFDPDAIVLADYFTMSLALERAGMVGADLRRFGRPLIAVDTWHVRKTGFSLDIYGEPTANMRDWVDDVDFLLTPAPTADPGDAAAHVYSSLPEEFVGPRRLRQHVRIDLGIPRTEAMVLTCTAGWQHGTKTDGSAARIIAAVPPLLQHYLSMLRSRVHLVHIGPAPFQTFGDSPLYHWLPSLPPRHFAAVLASADLLVTLNIAATTIAAALRAEVPVLNLQNSVLEGPPGEARTHESPPSAAARSLLESARPIDRFRLWPIGFYSFLEPLLADNPLTSALTNLELLDEDRVLQAVDDLVSPSEFRSRQLARQADYVATLDNLPHPADLLAASGLDLGLDRNRRAPERLGHS